MSRRRPIKHGTIGGYRTHYRHGVPMCEPCRHADRVARGRNVKRSAACGTEGGYNAHLNRDEPTCEPCRVAHTAAKDRYSATTRGDPWTFEDLVPVVRDATAAGATPDDIAQSLGLTRSRVGQALGELGRRHIDGCPTVDTTTRLPVGSTT